MTNHRDALARAREKGWTVAVHNDYRQNGNPMTFWLLTHPCGRWLKGEGKTDDAALALIDAALAEPDAPGVERIAQLLIDSGDCDWEGAKAPCHPTACFCMKQARAVAALYGAPPDAGALLAAAKKAKDYLIRELQEPGRSAFWTLVEAIRSFEAASGKGGSQP